jgi:23S rRNA (cytidine1920-2'-O)/16S rRNA (cytidine1409-2'-O)-methyltransferase
MATKGERLDIALVKRGLVETRSQARYLIREGKVEVNGQIMIKAGYKVSEADTIHLLEHHRYVSRGGLKLEAALKAFEIDVRGSVALDVGASTGGFTDCLRRHGASRVYAVDVGSGQLSSKLRQDSQVHVFEGTDIRYLKSLPETVDLVTIDVSFISLRLVLPAAVRFLKPETGCIIALIKPQFEAGPKQTSRRGIIQAESMRRQVVADILQWIVEQAWSVSGLIRSPIQGGEGNIEYLVCIHITKKPSEFTLELRDLWLSIKEAAI